MNIWDRIVDWYEDNIAEFLAELVASIIALVVVGLMTIGILVIFGLIEVL